MPKQHLLSRTRLAAPPDKLGYQFAPLPVAAVNDARISDGVFRALAVLMAVRNGDHAKISELRLSERLNCSARTAHSRIHELIDAGYIEQVNAKNGRCSTYRIVALTTANSFSALEASAGKPVQNPVSTTANGFSGTTANGFSVSRKIDINSRANATKKKNGDADQVEDDLERLDLVLAEIAESRVSDGTERPLESEVAWLLRRWPQPYQRRALIAHLRACAKRTELQTIRDIVERADSMTSRG
jgi:DNA-binding Lrp family transcriptional regulator